MPAVRKRLLWLTLPIPEAAQTIIRKQAEGLGATQVSLDQGAWFCTYGVGLTLDQVRELANDPERRELLWVGALREELGGHLAPGASYTDRLRELRACFLPDSDPGDVADPHGLLEHHFAERFALHSALVELLDAEIGRVEAPDA